MSSRIDHRRHDGRESPPTTSAGTERAEPPCASADRMPPPLVSVTGDVVTIDHLAVDDPHLVELIRRTDDPVSMLIEVLAVGARGVTSMGVGLDLAGFEHRIERTLADSRTAAERQAADLLAEARSAMSEILDPASRESVTGRTLAEFTEWRDQFLQRFDPDHASSHTARTLAGMKDLLGPGGALEERLAAALDPEESGSGLGRVSELIERRFQELRDLWVAERSRVEEAERGTAKGFAFEDVIEEALRRAARPLGAMVERTSTTPGALDRIVGDHVVTLASGARVVVEAKNTRSLSLTGDTGILGELDLAMANRDSDAAICVSRHADAFPSEVGPIGVYGRRVLVVDDGEGTLLWVALRWADQLAAAAERAEVAFDGESVRQQFERIRRLAERFRTNRRQLTGIQTSVTAVHESLGEMRSDLLEMCDDLARSVFVHPADVVDLKAG